MDDKKAIENFKEHVKDVFNLSEEAKISLFQNPKGFKIMFVENVNPNHRKIIYGRKRGHNTNCEKIAKIIIPSFVYSEMLTLFILLNHINFISVSLCLMLGLFIHNEVSVCRMLKIQSSEYMGIREMAKQHY